MATLLLTAAGTAVGGPIGGAIGAIVGQAADQAIFAPKTRRGPRLGDLAVQTSSYGTQIPKIFGRMRVAGTVIWATDLVETRSTSGGGKGRPRSVGYSYAANFAVALSARPVRAVHRIWADGRLLRGAAGDFKGATGFRFYPGDEDQLADPLIASAEGSALAPGYRGIAYAVFENFALEEFGNRIPSLTFELEADGEPLGIGRLAEELSGGAIRGGPSPTLVGYAASGESIRSALEALTDVAPLSLRDEGDHMLLSEASAPPVQLSARELDGAPAVVRRGSESAPSEVTLTYYDPDRDYQTGTQRAAAGGAQLRTDRRSLPAAVDAGTAKGLAEARLAALGAARSSATVSTSWALAEILPGARIRLEGQPGLWKVDRRLLGPMTLRLELSRLPSRSAAPEIASSGRAAVQADEVHGPTSVRLIDAPLPPPGDGVWLAAAAAGVEAGWRRAALSLAVGSAGDALWTDLGATAGPAVLGRSITAVPAAPSTLMDLRNAFEVELLNEAMRLESCTDAALAAGANLALIGAELVQFGSVETLGNRRVRLRRLLRGRRGTEWAAGQHGADEPFTLVDAEALVPIPLPGSAVGTTARLLATGIGDGEEGSVAECLVSGETMRPPAPAHLTASLDHDGALQLGWVRRSRLGWAWTDAGEVPLGEEQERYRVSIEGGAIRTFEVAAPLLLYSAGEMAADGVELPLTIRVSQIGTFLSSRAAVTTLA
jgi:hypothetical protein